jgi:P-type Ca2+ transporter type 2C
VRYHRDEWQAATSKDHLMPAAVSDLPDASKAYGRRIDDLVAALESDTRRGLTAEEAYARLQRYGRNEFAAQEPVPGWRRFLAQFQDVLVVLC